jgi:PmbA protein
MTAFNAIDLAQWTIEQARKAGADQAAVSVVTSRNVKVAYRGGAVETLQEATRCSLSLDVYVDRRFLNTSTNDLTKDALVPLIDQAVKGAGYLPADEYRMLPDVSSFPAAEIPDLMIDDPAYDQVKTEQRKRIAAELDRIANLQSDKVISATCGYSDSRRQITLINSEGFSGNYTETNFGMVADVSVDAGSGGRPGGWDSARTRYLSDLPDPEMVAGQAVRRALARIGQAKIETCRCDMIVENRVVGGRLLDMLQRPATARSLQQKQSFLDGKLGQTIASDKLTLIDDPYVAKGLDSRPFDGEGLTPGRLMMIEKGKLCNYYVDNYYGRKLGIPLTTGGPSNIIMTPGEKSLEALIAGSDRAILVTDFIGGNCNFTTGDFSIGIIGELIENGRIARPVSEMNIAGNALELWSNIKEVGSDAYAYSSARTPSILFGDVAFSGI